MTGRTQDSFSSGLSTLELGVGGSEGGEAATPKRFRWEWPG